MAREAKDLRGLKFGLLTPVSSFRHPSRRIWWICVCDCGNIKHVAATNLYNAGGVNSCGCLKTGRKPVHGLGKTRAYSTWSNMMARCYNPARRDHIYYKRLGVKVCKRWHTFENFFLDMGHPPSGLTLDRRDNTKGYCKSNCRWVTRQEQTRNRAITKMLCVDGVSKPVAEWSQETGVPYSSIVSRINSGYTGRQALYGVNK